MSYNQAKHGRREMRENVLGTGRHQVDTPFKEPDGVLHLSRALFGVLATGNHVEYRTAFDIESEHNEFSCLTLQNS